MDESQAQLLAAAIGGETWQSGGGIWLVIVHRADGAVVVFSGDTVCEYENDAAFDESRAKCSILLSAPQPNRLRRGARHSE